MAEGVAPPPDRRTFGQLLDEWVEFKAPRWAPKTLREAKPEIENRIRPRLGRIPVAKLTAKHLDDAFAARSKEGLGDSYVHRHAAVISAALSQGVKWGWLNANPAARASAPVQRTARQLVTPTSEMVAKLIRVAEETDPVMAAAVGLAFVTGGRRGELCALRCCLATATRDQVQKSELHERRSRKVFVSLSSWTRSWIRASTATTRSMLSSPLWWRCALRRAARGSPTKK